MALTYNFSGGWSYTQKEMTELFKCINFDLHLWTIKTPTSRRLISHKSNVT